MRRLLIALVGLSAACRHRADVTPAPAWYTVEVPVTVVNNNWSDARVYLVHDGVTERLGLVVAVSHATFSVPGRLFASGAAVRLRASLIGNSATVSTEPVLIQPDQAIIWTLEASLRNSTVLVQ